MRLTLALLLALCSKAGAAAPQAPKELPQRTSSDPKSPLIFAPKKDDRRVGGLALIERTDPRVRKSQYEEAVRTSVSGGFNVTAVQQQEPEGGRGPGRIMQFDANIDWPARFPPVGALVYGCEKGPLADAGIRMADVIYKVNSTPVADSAALVAAMEDPANTKGVLSIQRYNPRIKRYELKSVPFGR